MKGSTFQRRQYMAIFHKAAFKITESDFKVREPRNQWPRRSAKQPNQPTKLNTTDPFAISLGCSPAEPSRQPCRQLEDLHIPLPLPEKEVQELRAKLKGCKTQQCHEVNAEGAGFPGSPYGRALLPSHFFHLMLVAT